MGSLIELLTALGVVFTALGVITANLYSRDASKTSRSTNNAVNHTGEEGHRIYELARQNHEAIDQIQSALLSHVTKLADVEAKLKEHDDWERDKKYTAGPEVEERP